MLIPLSLQRACNWLTYKDKIFFVPFCIFTGINGHNPQSCPSKVVFATVFFFRILSNLDLAFVREQLAIYSRAKFSQARFQYIGVMSKDLAPYKTKISSYKLLNNELY